MFKTETILNVLLSVAFCLIFLRVAEHPASALARGTPKMILKQQIIDLKDVIEGKDITHSFEVLNEGDAPLKIEKVKPDCSCSVVHFDSLIPPDKQGKITVKVNTKGFEGKQRWGLKVLTNDPKWKEAVLDIRANIKPILILSGKTVQFTDKNEEAMTREIEIRTGIERDLLLTPERFTLPGKVTWSIQEIEKGRRYRVVFKSVPAKSEDYRGFLTLKTNFQEKPELTIWIIGSFTK